MTARVGGLTVRWDRRLPCARCPADGSEHRALTLGGREDAISGVEKQAHKRKKTKKKKKERRRRREGRRFLILALRASSPALDGACITYIEVHTLPLWDLWRDQRRYHGTAARTEEEKAECPDLPAGQHQPHVGPERLRCGRSASDRLR